jgi:murein DD-endopeptidase MepM/ murein hydrolase activator NlpD
MTETSGTRHVRLDRLDVFGEREAEPLLAYGPNDLERRVMRPGAERSIRYGRLVRRGTTAVVHVWVTLPNGTPVPRVLRNRLVLSDDGVGVPVGEIRADVPKASPLVLGPPLRGGLWFAHNGPGDHLSAHWGSVLVQNGRTTVPQRFAIDFIGLNSAGRGVRGDLRQSSNADWIGFGADVLAVADGVVHEARDGIVDNVPLVEPPPPAGLRLSDVAGNYVVLQLRANQFVHYVHLQRGSVAVQQGQRVRRGQVLGRVGNSGNTNGAHLHFNVVDASSTEDSEGIPFTFDSFNMLGATTPEQALLEAPPSRPSSPVSRRRALPLNGAIINFP